MQRTIRAAAMTLNLAIFALCGYVLGYHNGSNTPQVDREAIELAVFQAMMEK